MMHRTAPDPSFSIRSAWRAPGVLRDLLLSLPLLVLVLVLYTRFLAYNESRSGVVLPDPLLDHLPVADLSIPIFTVIYGGMVLALVNLVRRPSQLILTIRAYTLLMLARIAAMYVMPLAPPPAMIVLQDPVAGLGPGGAMRQDLFFSGHTATLVLLALTATSAPIRRLLALAAIAVAFMVLVQHCHYTVDVLAAPFFAYTCYRVMRDA